MAGLDASSALCDGYAAPEQVSKEPPASLVLLPQFEGPNNIVAFGDVRVLEYYSLEGVNKWAWIGYESIFLVVFLVLTWLALVTVRHQKR